MSRGVLSNPVTVNPSLSGANNAALLLETGPLPKPLGGGKTKHALTESPPTASTVPSFRKLAVCPATLGLPGKGGVNPGEKPVGPTKLPTRLNVRVLGS